MKGWRLARALSALRCQGCGSNWPRRDAYWVQLDIEARRGLRVGGDADWVVGGPVCRACYSRLIGRLTGHDPFTRQHVDVPR